MFVGHYAAGFALKKQTEEIPLWLLFISVQLVDILVFSLVLLGIEKISYNPSDNPFLRTKIEYVPYSHSLFANTFIAILVLLVFWNFKNRKWGIILGLGVLSHWFLDVLVHVTDMPLFQNELKVGLGLWNLPWLAFLFELSLLILAVIYLYKGYKINKRHIFMVILLILGFSSMFFAPEAEATPALASITSLFLYAVFTALAYWSERRPKAC